MIHVSAFERLSKSTAYRPGNLLAAIPFIAASYWRTSHNLDTAWKPPLIGAIFSWQRIYVVDWDGVPLDPANADHARRVFEIIPTPEQIGVIAMPPEMENFLIPQRAVTGPAASVSTLPVKPPGATAPESEKQAAS
jgi:hypothetical protein